MREDGGMGELREDIAEELKFQPKDRKLAFALLSASRTAALRHMGESWIIMEAGRQDRRNRGG
ncbi:hypothetical protein [Methanopyrus sp.]